MLRVEEIQRVCSNKTYQTILALLALIGLSLFSYWPGLNGTFQLDDFQNLSPLELFPDSDWHFRAFNFVFGGHAGPGGRPLSMASFLLNDFGWPSEPRSFLYTNILFHIINGILVFYLCLRLLPLLPAAIAERKQLHLLAAAICALIWTLHPLQVTTTLYIVQRMTELSAMFMLIGLIGHLALRDKVDSSRYGYVWLSLNLGLFGVLACLAKESGVLLVLYLLIIEKVLLQRQAPIHHRFWKHWQQVFLILPILVAIAYIALHSSTFQEYYQIREFTPWTRILTESRILLDYLYNILIPSLGGNGLYHDDYVLSQGLFDPPSTIISLIAVIGLVYAGFALKAKKPLLSFVLLWFFASHVLESTYLPLELYYEHRNYLAIFAFSLLVTVVAFSLPSLSTIRPWAQFAVVLLLVMVSGFTRMDAQVWGDTKVTPFIWLNEHPRSVRAAQHAVRVSLSYGELGTARKIMNSALNFHPHDASLNMQNMMLDCQAGEFDPQKVAPLLNTLRTARYSAVAIMLVSYLVKNIPLKDCPALNNTVAINITKALLNNSKINDDFTQYSLYFWLGELYIKEHNLNDAMENLDRSRDYSNNPDIPLLQANILISAGLFDDAERYLKISENYNNSTNVMLKNIYKKKIENMATLLAKNKSMLGKN